MDNNFKQIAECRDCGWKGTTGQLSFNWDESGNEVFYCPECEGVQISYDTPVEPKIKYMPEQTWKQYKRKGLSEMRPYEKGEDLSNISVASTDNPETDMGMIARDPKDPSAQHWYVNRKYFEDNLEEA